MGLTFTDYLTRPAIAGDGRTDLRGLRPAEKARQDHGRTVVHAALDESRQDIGDKIGLQHAAADRRVMRMVRQKRRRNLDHLDPAGAHRIGRGGVADMPEGHLALDRDDERERRA